MIEVPQAWPNFSIELKELRKLKNRFQDFKINYIILDKMECGPLSYDRLAMSARSFHINLCYVDYIFWSGYLNYVKFEL